MTRFWFQVAELRFELDARSISSKGLKSVLVGKLQKALKAEKEAVESKAGKEAAVEPEGVCRRTASFNDPDLP
jgi:hypothetical protein